MWSSVFAFATSVLVGLIVAAPYRSALAGDICSDMARFTLAPGFYPDGTGVDGRAGARNPTTTDELVRKMKDEWAPRVGARLRSLLLQPDMKDFRMTVPNAFGMECDLECKRMLEQDRLEGRVLNNVVAALTDLLLSDLLEGKSNSVFYSSFGGADKEPEIVFILEHPEYRKIREETRKDILAKNHLEDIGVVVKRVFDRVVPLLTDVLRDVVPDKDMASWMVDRVTGIQFEGTECNFGSDDERQMAQTLQVNAVYRHPRKTFQYCRGLILLNQSDFALVDTVAHELSHSIDPCNIAVGPGDYRFHYKQLSDPSLAAREYPIPNLIECLRDALPEGAYRGQRQIMSAAPVGADNPPMVTVSGGEASKSVPKAKYSPFCLDEVVSAGAEQMGEAVSDWLAAETLVRYVDQYLSGLSPDNMRRGYSNVFRGSPPAQDFTSAPVTVVVDSHPSLETRVNLILMAQPRIREHLGCSNREEDKPVYCPDDFRPREKDEELLKPVNSRSQVPSNTPR